MVVDHQLTAIEDVPILYDTAYEPEPDRKDSAILFAGTDLRYRIFYSVHRRQLVGEFTG